MQRLILLIVTYWVLTFQVYGQGTPGVLRCAFKGSLDIHASRESDSPIIAKIQCGEAILLVDQRFGSPHVRTEDGKDGFVIGLNLGQWSIEPESSASRLVVPEQISSPSAIAQNYTTRIKDGNERSNKDEVRQFEVLEPGRFLCGETIVADIGGHQMIESSDVHAYTYRAGPAFTLRSQHVSASGYVLAGGAQLQDVSYRLIGRTLVKQINTYSAFSGGIGGSLDVNLLHWLSLRAIQAEYSPVYFDGGWANGVKVGVGLSFRFGDR